jgi:hypothetical protein
MKYRDGLFRRAAFLQEIKQQPLLPRHGRHLKRRCDLVYERYHRHCGAPEAMRDQESAGAFSPFLRRYAFDCAAVGNGQPARPKIGREPSEPYRRALPDLKPFGKT